MARKRYTAEQIIGHLRQAEIRTSEGKTIAESVREFGISEQTYYRWRKQSSSSLEGPAVLEIYESSIQNPRWSESWPIRKLRSHRPGSTMTGESILSPSTAEARNWSCWPFVEVSGVQDVAGTQKPLIAKLFSNTQLKWQSQQDCKAVRTYRFGTRMQDLDC